MPEYFLRKSQLAGALETTAGTLATINSTSVKLKPLSDGFTYESDPQRFENQEVADDIGTSADFVTAVMGTINVQLTLKNSGVVGTAPAVGIYLQACGLKEQQVKTITVDNLANGPFAYGETFTSGSKTGIVDQALTVDGTLRYIPTGAGGDLANDDTVTGSGGATCDGASASSDLGWKYSPTTEDQKTITIQRAVSNTAGTSAKDWVQIIKGAMGTFTIEAEALNAARINFTFQGVEHSAGLGDLETDVTFESIALADIPKFINGTIQINATTVRPTSVSFDMGNEIIMEPDPSDSGGDTDGYDFARVSARSPQISLDPRTIDSFLDHEILNAGTLIPFDLSFGSTGQKIQLVTTSAQMREVSFGDRNGFQTSDKTLFVTRHATLADEDFRLYFT